MTGDEIARELADHLAKQVADARQEGWLAAAAAVEEPYPPEVFTPMTDDEVRSAVAAMNAAVPYASERMHAAWARHWADVLRRDADDG